MRRGLPILALMLLLSAAGQGGDAGPVRFETLQVFIDSGTIPLAAWQLDVAAASGSGVKIVGIEGGEHRVFANPPYYDAKAMEHERVIIAAFSNAASASLPSGRTRVATIHYMAGGGEPRWQSALTVAATSGGADIPAKVSLVTGTK